MTVTSKTPCKSCGHPYSNHRPFRGDNSEALCEEIERGGVQWDGTKPCMACQNCRSFVDPYGMIAGMSSYAAERCHFCNTRLIENGDCSSCLLYNAAVEAQKVAANRIAKDWNPNTKHAWLNQYGVFAWINGQATQVASAAAAAPFVALTTATRNVKF